MMANHKKTELSKRKHADFMLRMAEKTLSLVYAGLLGGSAMLWITRAPANDLVFIVYLLLLGIGGGIGVQLMRSALKCYARLEQ